MRVIALGALLAVTAASAKDWAVSVGADGLAFSPNSVMATVGDVIVFTFFPKNHTVTQSTFASPCQKAGTINSGFMPVVATDTMKPAFRVTVNSTDPLWFYCAQTGHCTSGMVFAVNPTAALTFVQFQQNAKNGGTVTTAGSSGSSSAAGSTTPTQTTGGAGSGTSTAATGAASGTSTAATGAASGASTTAGAGSGASTGSGTSAPAPSNSNAALAINTNFAGLLTLVGVIAGIAF